MIDVTPEESKKHTKEFLDSSIGNEVIEHVTGCDVCAKINTKMLEVVLWHVESMRKLK